MSVLSVVVPVHNVEGYVRQCLTSILSQAAPDTEVIVVDDHSTDRSGVIVREIAAGDARVKVVTPEANVGLGPARNLGLEQATGEYVLFLDSDDFFCPGALDAISRRAQQTGADLVVFDYERVYWNDRRRRNMLAPVLSNHPDPITLADEPDLLRVLNVAWNKAYRRSFLLESGIEFPVGYYEDIPFTYPLLCKASSIALLDRVCVGYRQRRGGSILRSVDDRHFEVLDQVETLLDMVDERPEMAKFSDEIWHRAATHVIAVMSHGPKRLPPGRRRAFFERSAAILGPRQPTNFDLEPRLDRRVKMRLLAENRYLEHEGMKRMNATRSMARRRARRLGRRVKTRLARLRRTYRSSSSPLTRSPNLDPNLAVFTSLWNRPPTGNPLAIYRKLAEMAPHINAVWAVRDTWQEGVDDDISIVSSGTAEYRKLIESATWLVNDVNFPDHFELQEGQTFLQTQHGTPLKFMGLDLQAYPVAADGMNFSKLMKRVDQWTYNLSSNRFSTEVWRRAFPAKHDILEFGYPRNDILADPPDGLGEATRKALGVPQGNTVILYTPTHRDGVKRLDLGLDPVRFIEGLGEGHTLIVRGHYFYEPSADLGALQAAGRIIDGSGVPEIEHLYLASDAMICDYSSAMFDYAILDRPIVIFGYDWERYRTLRGTYFDIMKEPPGVAVATLDDLIEAFRSGSSDSEDARQRRARFRSIFCQFDDGRAAERVVRKVFLGQEPDVVTDVCGPPAALETWVVDRPG